MLLLLGADMYAHACVHFGETIFSWVPTHINILLCVVENNLISYKSKWTILSGAGWWAYWTVVQGIDFFPFFA